MLGRSKEASLSGLKGTYLPILKHIVNSNGDDLQEGYSLQFKRVVGLIILLYDPLSTFALADLLRVHPGDVGRVLRPLHSVLNIPQTADGKTDRRLPITLFHLSFRDFLIDPDLRHENMFWIEPKERHSALGIHCITLLESGILRENLCGVANPGIRRSEVERSTVDTILPEAVAYACSYWAQHIVESDESVHDGGRLHRFLEKHFLHWVEALSWLGKASEVVPILDALRIATDVSCVITSA
jgi:hypothetical protein